MLIYALISSISLFLHVFFEKLPYLGYFDSGSRETLTIFSSHILLYNALVIVLKIEKYFSSIFLIERYNNFAIHSYTWFIAHKCDLQIQVILRDPSLIFLWNCRPARVLLISNNQLSNWGISWEKTYSENARFDQKLIFQRPPLTGWNVAEVWNFYVR